VGKNVDDLIDAVYRAESRLFLTCVPTKPDLPIALIRQFALMASAEDDKEGRR